MDDRQDAVPSLVKRRPDEIVHSRIGDHESLSTIALDVENPGQQGAGLGDQEAARLNQQTNLQTLQGTVDRSRILFSP